VARPRLGELAPANLGLLAAAAGAPGMRPYDLRHASCSLIVAEGLSVVEVARRAGHAPTMTLDTYDYVMADLDGSEHVPAKAAIRAARAADVSVLCPPHPRRADAENPVFPESPPSDSNRKPFQYK
jgi:hypothetical protein